MSEASKEILTRQLATLLGFDDGADGVLDHLLTIESGEVSAEIAFLLTNPHRTRFVTDTSATCHPTTCSLETRIHRIYSITCLNFSDQ
jgi:hypothetical protein